MSRHNRLQFFIEIINYFKLLDEQNFEDPLQERKPSKFRF